MEEDSGKDKLERLFEAALARPKEERKAFLKETCSDAALRKEVSSLVEAYEKAPAFFEGLVSSVVIPMLDKIEEQEVPEEEVPGKEKGSAASGASDPLDLEGKRIEHYQVKKHLGRGGMGVVYRARDTRLDRSVALKFLPPHLSWHEEAEERFLREARSAAALDHSNVATIHEIGQTEGSRRFIAMAYYEGETLKEKLSREGPLPVEEALAYARQIAEGLGRAHEAGIVHRDIKPANVMVTRRGEVKLVDFGLARVAEETRLTDPGRRLGTAAYMSPEQARGEAIDHRTDLWALGSVLYEMLTGERPFQGKRETAVLHAVLHEEPEPVSQRRSEVPAELERIVDRLLAKDLKERYASAKALLEDLRAISSGASSASAAPAFLPAAIRPSGLPRHWLMGGAVLLAALVFVGAWWFASGGLSEGRTSGGEAETGRERSVAVLPFQVSGAGAETWRDGMVTVLSTGLDGAAGFRAIPDRTVFAAFERAGPARSAAGQDRALETARQIGARYAVTGSAVTLSEELRLIADVYETASGERLGRAQVRGASENIMALADELTRRVLGILLERSEEQMPSVDIASLTTESFPALKAFLRGERRFRAGDYKAAIEDYEAAVKADSTFALAHVRLGRSYRWLVELEKGLHHWQRAYEMSDRLPERERRVVRAQHLWLVQDSSLATVNTLRQLTDAYPDDPRMWYELGEAVFHGNVPGGWPEAEMAFEAAIDLDPGVASYHHHFVDLAFALRRDSALAARRIAAHPESPYKPLYRLTLDLVFGSPDQQQEALARLDTMSIPGQMLPTGYALEHPVDAKIMERVRRRLVNRDDRDAQAIARRLTINLFERGRFEEGLAQIQEAQLNPAFESCILATAVSFGVPIPASDLRLALEPSEIEEGASVGRLRCAGIYLLERGRGEELPTLFRRIREAGDEQGLSEDELQRLIDELGGYQAWKAEDLKRAARLWSDSNPSGGGGAIWRGDLYRELGELERAEGWYLAAWRRPVTHERLGQLYEEMDQSEKAAEAYKRFIKAWAEADEPLQERVEAAKNRLEVLSPTSANAVATTAAEPTAAASRDPADVPGVAVLPFESIGVEAPSTFTEGLHGDLLARLAQVSGLQVISQTSVEQYRDAEKTTAEIARELGAQWILEGAVQAADGHVQVRAQLVNPRSDTYAWSDQYRRELTAKDLFALQSEITMRIARSLEAELTPEEEQRVAGVPTEDLEAYRFYVRGRQALNTRTADGIRRAIGSFRRAIGQDSTYALAWTGLADARTLDAQYSTEELDPIADSLQAAIPEAEAAARRALELEPNLAEAHTSRAIVYIYEMGFGLSRGNGPRALRHLRRAVELKPSYAEAHNWLGILYLLLGRPAPGLKHASLAAELSPDHYGVRSVLQTALFANGKNEAALTEARRHLDAYPERERGLFYKSTAFIHLKRWNEVRELAWDHRSEADDPPAWTVFFPALADAAMADTASAQDRIQELRARGDDWEAALVHAALGEVDAAFRTLPNMEEWPIWNTWKIRYHYPDLLSSFRADPRYEKLIRKVNEYWGLTPDGSLPEESSSTAEL